MTNHTMDSKRKETIIRLAAIVLVMVVFWMAAVPAFATTKGTSFGLSDPTDLVNDDGTVNEELMDRNYEYGKMFLKVAVVVAFAYLIIRLLVNYIRLTSDDRTLVNKMLTIIGIAVAVFAIGYGFALIDSF